MKQCMNCILRYNCDEQTEFYCENKEYIYYNPQEMLKDFIGKRSLLPVYDDAIDDFVRDKIKEVIFSLIKNNFMEKSR